MKRISDTSEVLGTVEVPEGLSEVCVSADASFDEAASRLVVKLDAFLRPTDLHFDLTVSRDVGRRKEQPETSNVVRAAKLGLIQAAFTAGC